MNTWAAPGVKCVCVCDDWDDDYIPPEVIRLPMMGEVLTIRDVEIGHFIDGSDATLLFEEFPEFQGPYRAWHRAACFRPLVTKPQSVDHDVALFKPVPVHIRTPQGEDA